MPTPSLSMAGPRPRTVLHSRRTGALPHRASPSFRRHAMPVHRPGPVHPRRPLLAGLLLAALSLVLAVPATPASAADTPARGSARMGMGVAAHDGTAGTPSSADATQTEGVDVSGYQGNVAWST